MFSSEKKRKQIERKWIDRGFNHIIAWNYVPPSNTGNTVLSAGRLTPASAAEHSASVLSSCLATPSSSPPLFWPPNEDTSRPHGPSLLVPHSVSVPFNQALTPPATGPVLTSLLSILQLSQPLGQLHPDTTPTEACRVFSSSHLPLWTLSLQVLLPLTWLQTSESSLTLPLPSPPRQSSLSCWLPASDTA